MPVHTLGRQYLTKEDPLGGLALEQSCLLFALGACHLPDLRIDRTPHPDHLPHIEGARGSHHQHAGFGDADLDERNPGGTAFGDGGELVCPQALDDLAVLFRNHVGVRVRGPRFLVRP